MGWGRARFPLGAKQRYSSHCIFYPGLNQKHTGRRKNHPEMVPFVLRLRERRHSDCPFWEGALGGNIVKSTQADLGRHPSLLLTGPRS